MADLWDQLVKTYPRYTIAILLVYALLVSAYTAYSSVRSYYIELRKSRILKTLADACGNVSEIAARISRSDSYPAGKVEDFLSSYGGGILFEDSNLVGKMVAYRGCPRDDQSVQLFGAQAATRAAGIRHLRRLP